MQDQGSPALLCLGIQPTLCPPVTSFLSSTALLTCSILGLYPRLTLHGTWVINSPIKTLRKGNGWDEGDDTFKYCTRPSGRWSWSRGTGLSLNYLRISPLSYCMICTYLVVRFGKFKFRLPSSLRNSSILEKIKVQTNQLDVKHEWEAQSIIISVSLWIFLFAVFSSYSSWTRKDNWKSTRQTASPTTYTFLP